MIDAIANSELMSHIYRCISRELKLIIVTKPDHHINEIVPVTDDRFHSIFFMFSFNLPKRQYGHIWENTCWLTLSGVIKTIKDITIINKVFVNMECANIM